MKNKIMIFIYVIISITVTHVCYASSQNCLDGCPITPSANFDIDHDIYEVSINPETKFPDWIAYIVKSEYFIGGPDRPRNWRVDADIPDGYQLSPYCEGRTSDKSCDDYKGASAEYKYQRGHLAPLATFKAHPDWAKTNYYSNITPQLAKLNNGPWKQLEAQVRELAMTGKTVYVLAGTLYDGIDMPELPYSDDSHEVPTDYWKIIAVQESGYLKVAAFIFQQNAPTKGYCSYAKTVDLIERRSGLVFFPSNQEPIKSLKSDLGC